MEVLKSALGLSIVHIPYKGTGQSIPALVGGDVALAYSALPSIAAHVKAGRVKLLAVSTTKRSPTAPEVPTVAELGIPGYDFAPEIGLLAPAGTPLAIIARMSQEVAKALKCPRSRSASRSSTSCRSAARRRSTPRASAPRARSTPRR